MGKPKSVCTVPFFIVKRITYSTLKVGLPACFTFLFLCIESVLSLPADYSLSYEKTLTQGIPSQRGGKSQCKLPVLMRA